MPATATPNLLTAEDIASLLRVSKRQIWRLASAGHLPGRVKLGRLTRWRQADIQRRIEAGCPNRS